MIGKKTKNLFLNFNVCQKGTTLLEIIVAVGIFSVTILCVAGIFQSVSDGQRSAIAAQNVQEEIRYALEIMAREIRMAQVEQINNKDCKMIFKDFGFKVFNKIYNTNNDDHSLYFKNEKGDCVMYFIKENRLAKIKEDLNPVFLTSNKININNLNFFVSDSNAINIQPKVTMTFDVEYIGKKMYKQRIKIQTTVSSRYYGGKPI